MATTIRAKNVHNYRKRIILLKVAGVNRYAFIQFANLEDARRAVHKMQGERIGKNQVATCYARSIKTQVLWFHGVSLVSDEGTFFLFLDKSIFVSKFLYRKFLIFLFEFLSFNFFCKKKRQKATYKRQFEQFGSVRSLVLDRVKCQLLVAFQDIASANTAYIEYKEKGRKLNNTRMSCDFCSEELLQSVLYDDIVKKGHVYYCINIRRHPRRF